MPVFSRPSADADEAGPRGLAHATRSSHDPTEICAVLGSLSQGLVSLDRVLHQLGQFHDGPARNRVWMTGDPSTGRAASYQIAWEMHRAAEIAHQVAAGIDRAHEIEATTAYDVSSAWSGVRCSALSAEQRAEVGYLLTVEPLLKDGATLELDGLRPPRS